MQKLAFIISLAVILLIAGALIFDMRIQVQTQSEQIEQLQAQATIDAAAYMQELNSKEAQKDALISLLQDMNATLQEVNAQLQSEQEAAKQLGKQTQVLQGELDNFNSKITAYEESLAERMAWFSANAELGDYGYDVGPKNSEYIKRTLAKECSKQEDVCSINLACLDFKNDKVFKLKYATDVENNGDQLQSLASFFTNGQGDCEDYSLLYKAQMNYLTSTCTKEIQLETFTTTTDNPQKFEITYEENPWFIPNVGKVTLEQGYVNPIIVCGMFYDPSGRYRSASNYIGAYSGHCLIGFTKEPLTSYEDARNAPLVEPQTGEYLGKIGDGKYTLLDKTNWKTFWDKKMLGQSGIYLFITDEDVHTYAEKSSDWQSYQSLIQEIVQLKKGAQN